MVKSIAKQDKEYLESGRWKCNPLHPLPSSPTGAHHWISVVGEGIKPGTFVCKYCYEVKIMPLVYEPYGGLKDKVERRKHGRTNNPRLYPVSKL